MFIFIKCESKLPPYYQVKEKNHLHNARKFTTMPRKSIFPLLNSPKACGKFFISQFLCKKILKVTDFNAKNIISKKKVKQSLKYIQRVQKENGGITTKQLNAFFTNMSTFQQEECHQAVKYIFLQLRQNKTLKASCRKQWGG